MWFTNLMGFKEESPENVREKIYVDGNCLVSKVNGKSFQFGNLEIPSLNELRDKTKNRRYENATFSISEIIGNIQEIHSDEKNAHALFQAASQFNLLEMVSPNITPERGVDIYEKDFTQGPACAIACGAGTIYRNYFVNETGQSSLNQINCLSDIGEFFENDKLHLWNMSNGYALCNRKGLLTINKKIADLTYDERENLKGNLRVGIQWNSEVTLNDKKQIVNQIYCSALPVAYSQIESVYWESFSRLILEATYEATLNSALINYELNGCRKVFLTLVGGGAFGNDINWVIESISKVLVKFKNTPLDISIVSYGHTNRFVQKLINEHR